DLDRVRIADTLEFALLQHAQQLRLQRGAHRPDFVQEEGALVRLFEASLASAHGAGERAAHMTEQLGFEQRLRNGAAVDRNEAIRAARAVVMNGARGELFSRSRLASDQDGARRRGHGLEQLKQLAHDAAVPDQVLSSIALLELRS